MVIIKVLENASCQTRIIKIELLYSSLTAFMVAKPKDFLTRSHEGKKFCITTPKSSRQWCNEMIEVIWMMSPEFQIFQCPNMGKMREVYITSVLSEYPQSPT